MAANLAGTRGLAPSWSGVLITPARQAFRALKRKPLGFAGLAILLVIGFAAVFAPLIAPYGYAEVDFVYRLKGPSWDHLLGTDNLGRDSFSRILYGSRISLGISFTAVLLAKATATAIGIVSGYYGGWFDKIFQRFVDVWISLPTLIILVSVISILGPGIIGLTAIIALAVTASSSRLIRSVVLQVRREAYVEAALSMGARDGRIMLRHIFPNVTHIVIYSSTVSLGSTILIVASLGFLGYGVPPPHPDLGGMLSGDGLTNMRRQPWLAIGPGAVITAIVFSFNVFGDALRDMLDPKLRGR